MIPLRVPQFFELYIDYSIDLLSFFSVSTFAACFFLLQTPSDCIPSTEVLGTVLTILVFLIIAGVSVWQVSNGLGGAHVVGRVDEGTN